MKGDDRFLVVSDAKDDLAIATVCGDNPSVVALLKRLRSRLDVSWQGREREFGVGLES